MVKLNNIKKAWISIIIFCIAVLLGSNSVQAVYFSGWKNGSNPLWTSREFYCIEHQDYFTVGNWNKVSEQVITSNDASQSNRALAYILRDAVKTGDTGYNGKGAHQYAVWRWYYNAGINTKYPGENAIYNAGMKQPQIKYSNSKSNIKVANTKITMTGEIGSFKFTELSGTNLKFEITWANKTTKVLEQNDKISNWIEFYSDSKCTKPLKISAIKKNQMVYFKNLSNQEIKSIKATVMNQASGYKVTISRYKKSTGQASQQDLISAKVEEGQNTSVSVTMNITYTYGKILIKKIGVYTENDQKITDKNVNATFKLYCNTLGKWVSGDADSRKTYVDSIDKATEYKSNTIVTKLFSTYKYELVEVKVNNPEYNPIKMVGATSKTGDSQTIKLPVGKNGEYYTAKSVIVHNNKTNTVTVEDERAVGNLKILKVDDNHKDIVLSGAEFIIKKEGTENWIIKNSDGTYNYNGKYEDVVNNKVGVYTTNAQGIAEINKLKYDTYHIYEIKAPDGYNIEKQDKYDQNKKWIDLGTAVLGATDTNVTYTVTNKKVVSLEGRVWQDISMVKGINVGDHVYRETTDALLAGINVSLYNADNKVIATTTTDDQGHYKFENLNYWDLAGCYVEFTYDNINYVVVDPFVEKDIKINSKAIEETMTVEELEDDKLTGTKEETKEDLPGKAITYKGGNKLTPKQILDNNKAQDKDLNITPLTGYYNEETYTIEDINLGLLKKINQEIYVGENLEYIKISLNGYTYTYKYGDEEIMNSQFVPTVEKQKNKFDYYAKLCPTDVAYDSTTKDTEELKVYAVYSIGVENNTITQEDDIYYEKNLYLSELKATYDTDRFELSKDAIGDAEENKQFKLWEGENGQAYFTLDETEEKGNVFANGIEPNIQKEQNQPSKRKTTHIQFKVKNDVVNKILTNPELVNNSKSATQVFAKGYHEYLRTDNVWTDNKDVIAFNNAKGTYDKANTNGTKYYVHKSTEVKDESSGLGLKFELGEDRTLSGTVFEDNIIENSLGNGILDNSEQNRAQKVKVELLNENGEVVNLYQKVDENGKIGVKTVENNELPKAITTTNSDGTYTFEGVVPGYYFIRFTYSEKDENGVIKQVMKTADGDKLISSQDYRSTIINTKENNSIIKTAMENKNNIVNEAKDVLIKYYKKENIDPTKMSVGDAKKVVEWYKYLGDTKYSTAVDKITGTDGRTNLDENEYTKNTTLKDNAIPAYTPIISISIENDTIDEKQIPAEQQLNPQQKETEKDKSARIFDAFNFGLIKQNTPNITTDKKLTNVKFTNQAGTTLVSENPASKQSTYVTALDAITDETGCKYAKLEIDPELIYGSNVELTYEISIANNSVEDFVEDVSDKDFGDYYKYGTTTAKTLHKKKITVKALEDDLDSKFNYNSVPTSTTQTTSFTTRSEPNNITIKPTTVEETDLDETKTTSYLEMTGWESLESGQSTKTSYTVTALIANDDLDSAYKNDAKIKSLSLDTLTSLTTKSKKIWEADNTVFTITSTTGENRNYIYWYVGAAALVIVASGLIFIKKKVL